MRILMTFLGKTSRNPSQFGCFRPFVLIMMDFCGFFQGKSSELAMHNADFLQRKWFPQFFSVIAVMAHPVLQHRHVNFLTSRASPFGLCFQFSFRHNGFLYKTTRISPRVTTQRCRHWQRGMAIANANANENAAMRCTKPSNPPRPPLLRGRFGIDSTSTRHCQSTLEEGRARRIQGWGLGGLCLINPSQHYNSSSHVT